MFFNRHLQLAIFWALSLIALSWFVPIVIFISAPFGNVSVFVSQLAFNSLFFYIVGTLAAFFSSRKKFRRAETSRLGMWGKPLLVFGLIFLLINIYVYAQLGNVPLLDHKLRDQMRGLYGFTWSLMFVYISFALVVRKKVAKFSKFIIYLNISFMILSGLKLVILLVIVSLFVTFLSSRNLEYSSKVITARSLSRYGVLVFILFAISFSLRARTVYTLESILTLFYLYIAPNFTNASNFISSYSDDFISPGAGVFSAVFSLFSPSALSRVSSQYLEHETWNVWSVLVELYVANGASEIYLTFFLLGLATTMAFYYFFRSNSAASQTFLIQIIMTHLFLHNQYYLASISSLTVFVLSFLACHNYRLDKS